MKQLLFSLFLVGLFLNGFTQPALYVNQVGFESNGPKIAVIGNDGAFESNAIFNVIQLSSGKAVYSARLGSSTKIDEWFPERLFYQADFSAYKELGKYKISINVKGKLYDSEAFEIENNALAMPTIPSIIHYYTKQRANKPAEIEADKAVLLYGSNKRVDLRGGWDDASGDISKYFSHLAYANFMSPQQIPLVAWSMANTSEEIPVLLTQMGMADSIRNEAVWGADYMLRSLSEEGYFYMTVFSYFNPDPKARRVVGLNANSVTTSNYQCAFREGGGMAIAALARIARWNKDGDFTSKQYLSGAKRAFAHLLVNNIEYCDDGKENILDDYTALMAATELWITTNATLYRDEARRRAQNLKNRLSNRGYFIADDANRPFWHAADAGLPIVALARYLSKEKDPALRQASLNTIKKALDYQMEVTQQVDNPFGYARQSFVYDGSVKNGFFIPHENETGWWWQGENARLGSLATAAIVGGRLVYPKKGGWGIQDRLAKFASRQLSWILGGNPYSMCFMYGFGQQNVPYMKSMYGHGSEKGGISNGITGKDGQADGSGIDFKMEANGNEWRWAEQWIPHAAWFLQAVSAISSEKNAN